MPASVGVHANQKPSEANTIIIIIITMNSTALLLTCLLLTAAVASTVSAATTTSAAAATALQALCETKNCGAGAGCCISATPLSLSAEEEEGGGVAHDVVFESALGAVAQFGYDLVCCDGVQSTR